MSKLFDTLNAIAMEYHNALILFPDNFNQDRKDAFQLIENRIEWILNGETEKAMKSRLHRVLADMHIALSIDKQAWALNLREITYSAVYQGFIARCHEENIG